MTTKLYTQYIWSANTRQAKSHSLTI